MFSERTTLQRLLLLKALSGGGQSLVERTALGNPLTFGTDVSKSLKSLLIPFTPQQEGTGDPSPSNIRSILPWNGLSVFGSGKNIVTNGFTKGVLDLNTGRANHNPNYIVSEFIPVVPLKSYYFRCPTVEAYELDICYYDKDKQYLGYTDADGYSSCNVPGRSRKTPAGCYYVRIDTRNAQYNNDICINYPASVTGYVPAVGITETDISFPSPVYGGTLDVVSGVLTVEWGMSTLNGQEMWVRYSTSGDNNYRFRTDALSNRLVGDNVNGTQKCDCLTPTTGKATSGNSPIVTGTRNSITFMEKSERLYVYVPDLISDSESLNEWKTYVSEHPIMVVYKLATPQEITLTPEQIIALKGNNTIWSDADGSMTGVYLVSSKYAEEHPVGGLGSGLGSGLLGSGTEDNPEDPADDPIDDPEEEIPDNTEEGSESDD